MISRSKPLLSAIGILVLIHGASLRAAELRLKSQCRAACAVVTLGDVAEIFTADDQAAASLAAIELFPSPPPLRQRFIRLRELQDLLILRGVNLTEHRFSGSSQVAIAGGSPARVQPVRPLSLLAARGAEQRVCRAVTQYLQQYASADSTWTVGVDLTPEQVQACSAEDAAISVRGGAPPWTGNQRFEVTIGNGDGPATFYIDAQVTAPRKMVVAVRSLSRGVTVCATDVELCSITPSQAAADGFRAIEQVVGRETTRAIPKGKPLSAEMLRAPLLVRRGDVVTVIARSAGIRIRTTARARDDGSLDDLVAVESLAGRQRYFARVTGVREVDVFGRSARAGPAPRPVAVKR